MAWFCSFEDCASIGLAVYGQASITAESDADMRRMMKRLIAGESGESAIEYGLIAALISVGIIASLYSTRSSLVTDYNCIANQMGSAGGGCAGGAAAQPSAGTGTTGTQTQSSYSAQSYWAAKTPTTRTVNRSSDGTLIQTTFNFNDGSQVQYNVYPKQTDPNTYIRVNITDITAQTSTALYFDAKGNETFANFAQDYNNMQYTLFNSRTPDPSPANFETGTSRAISLYTVNNGTPNTNGPPTDDQYQRLEQSYRDAQYFGGQATVQ
jgi:pilus assembly protein Flp/PilA